MSAIKFVSIEQLREKYFKFLNDEIFLKFFKHPYLTRNEGFASEALIIPCFGYLIFYKETERSPVTEVWFNEANESMLSPKCWRLLFVWDTNLRGPTITSMKKLLDDAPRTLGWGGQFVLGSDSLVDYLVSSKIVDYIKENGYDG